jgi:hypothetical protein
MASSATNEFHLNNLHTWVQNIYKCKSYQQFEENKKSDFQLFYPQDGAAGSSKILVPQISYSHV